MCVFLEAPVDTASGLKLGKMCYDHSSRGQCEGSGMLGGHKLLIVCMGLRGREAMGVAVGGREVAREQSNLCQGRGRPACRPEEDKEVGMAHEVVQKRTSGARMLQDSMLCLIVTLWLPLHVDRSRPSVSLPS